MNQLVYSNSQRSMPTNIHGNNIYGHVMLNDDDGKVDFTKTYRNPKTSPFTIKMIKRGTIRLTLLPFLNIVNGGTIIFRYNVRPTDVTFPQTGSQTFTYNRNDVNVFTSSNLSPGTTVQISIQWEASGERSFGNMLHAPSGLTFVTEEWCSSLFINAEAEVFGNIGSLLCTNNDRDFIFDNYNAGKKAFKYFFRLADRVSYDSRAVKLDGRYSDSAYIVDAYNLYLPKLNVESAYEGLFYSCAILNYPPRYLYACPKTKYFYQICNGCSELADDYDLIIDGNIESGQTDNMSEMFFGSRGGNTLYYVMRNVYREFNVNMTGNSAFTRLVASPGGNISASLSTIGMSSAVLVLRNLYSIIWVDDVDATLASNSLTLSTYMNDVTLYSRPYIYKGTAWVESDFCSYYIWEYYSAYDTSSNGNGPNTNYVLTSEKDFISMTLEETGKNIIRPIKYITNNTSGAMSTAATENVSKLTITKFTGVVPEDNAGVPMIGVDEDIAYSIYEDDRGQERTWWNYYVYNCDEFKLVGSLNNNYIWDLYKMNTPDGVQFSSILYKGRDYDGNLQGLRYLKTGTLQFKNTLRNNGTTTNTYNITMLYTDKTTTYKSNNNMFIIYSNNICPETCTFVYT